MLADKQDRLHVHLEAKPLGGGGYQTMLNRAIRYRKQGLSNGRYKQSFLLLDGDRADSGEDWSIDQLKQKAGAKTFILCCQMPNFEGRLLRLFPGKERVRLASAKAALEQLVKQWPDYQKPANALTLGRKYCLDDLKRAAGCDADLQLLLEQIGLC